MDEGKTCPDSRKRVQIGIGCTRYQVDGTIQIYVNKQESKKLRGRME